MKALILENPGWAFTIMAIAGALLHWAKKAYRGEATWNPIDYWFADNRMHSAGTGGALVTAIWAVVYSDSLTGMQYHMIVASGITLGWMLDSGINKGAPVPYSTKRPFGFARLAILPILIALALLVACSTPGPKPEAPRGIPEQIEAADLAIGHLSDTIVALTCTQFDAGRCIEPGKPLMPDVAIKVHEPLVRAQAGLVSVVRIGAGGTGECLGAQRTQAACLSAVRSLMLEADRMLIQAKGGES